MVEMSLKVDRNSFDYEGLTQTQWALKQAYLMGYRFDFNTQELALISGKRRDGRRVLSKFRYPTFSISVSGCSFTVFVHRLAMYQVYGDILFEQGMVVRHLNDVPTDLRFENLAIGTSSDNILDIPPEKRKMKNIFKRTGKTPHNKTTSNEVAESVLNEYLPHLKLRLAMGMQQARRNFLKDLRIKYDLSKVVIESIVCGKSFNKLYIEKCLQYGLEPKRFRCDGSIRERDYELEILKKVL